MTDMSKGWQTKQFNECACLIRDVCLPCEVGDLPYVGLEHIEQGTLRFSEIGRSIDVISLKSRFEPGDILFGKLRPYFRKVVRPRFAGVCSTDIMVVRAKQSTDQGFLFYWMASQDFVNTATRGSEGTKMPRAKWDFLEKIKKSVPSLVEQRAIAAILGSLDDKIELNRQVNETLEAMAQALFKNWFVDFEPFRSQGMQDSTLGAIPGGWRVDKLSETCDITMGQSPPGDTYNEIGNGVPFYQGIKDFGFRFPNHRIYCTKPTRFANVGDVLLSVRAPVGNLNMSSERCAIGRGLAALRLKKKQKGYLYYLLRTTQGVWEKFDSEGTVFGCIKKTDIHNSEVIMPPESIIEEFDNLVEPFDSRITSNENESTTLASIRDALLPKLMSGEIRVKDVEKFMERVV